MAVELAGEPFGAGRGVAISSGGWSYFGQQETGGAGEELGRAGELMRAGGRPVLDGMDEVVREGRAVSGKWAIYCGWEDEVSQTLTLPRTSGHVSYLCLDEERRPIS